MQACGCSFVDVHTHVVPFELPFVDDGDPRWARVVRDGDRGRVVVNGQLFRTVSSSAWDLEHRLDDLDRTNVELQVLSPMPELFAYWAPAADAEWMCRGMNEWLAAAVAAYPTRYRAFGILPLQDPDAAAAMVGEVRALGLDGVEVGSNVGDLLIADPRFEAVFEELAAAGLVLFVHATKPRHAPVLGSPLAANAIGFPLEAGCSVATLILNGVLHRHPELRILASHGGGAITSVLPRLRYLWQRYPELQARLPEPPDACARRIFYDFLVFDPAALECLIALVGEDQVVAGSDYPFLPDSVAGLAEPLAGLPGEIQHGIRAGNARRLLRRSPVGAQRAPVA